MTELISQVRQAARRLRQTPVFSLATLLVLTLGIGATTALFSIVNGVLLRPLPYTHPGRLVDLSHSIVVQGVAHVEQSDATFMLYHRESRVFDGIAAYRNRDVNLAPGTSNAGDAQRVTATGVTAGLLGVLGVTPARGRGFVESDDQRDAARVVLLSDGIWKRRFGGEAGIVGKRVLIDGVPTEVIGVMPERFQFPSKNSEIWYPLRFDPAHTQAGSFNYKGVARLKENVTIASAIADLDRVLPRLLEEFPGDIPPELFAQVHLHPTIRPLRDVMVEDVSRLLWILFGAGGLVLLMACANVANLFLVRGEARHRELAVRTALGAGRSMILTQYLSEALLLAALGGVLALVLAEAAVKLLATLPSGISLPRLGEVAVDGRVVAFVAVITLFAAVAVSLIPLLRARKIPVASVLKDSGRSATAGAARQRSRNALVVAQVALALVLVAGSGLVWRSFARLRDVNPGFASDHVLTMRVSLPVAKYPTTVARMQYYDRLAADLQATPGVTSTAFTTWLPLTDYNDNSALMVEDHPVANNGVPPVHEQSWGSNNYFAAMGIPLLSGRTFGAQDPARAVPEAIVSRAFAARYWKDASPLGKRLRPGISGPWYTIVGVVGDVHLKSLDQPAEQVAYFPMVTPDSDSTSAPGTVAIVVHTAGDPGALTSAVRDVVHKLDPSIPTYDEEPMATVLRDASARARFTMLLLACAGAIALTLGAVGIYGVMAYGVSLRQREIGVRMALGARPSDVSQMISRQGVSLAALGVAIGLVAAVAVTRFMSGLLYDVSSTDPLTLGGTCLLLLAVALVASWLPARRAAAVDPAVALRSD